VAELQGKMFPLMSDGYERGWRDSDGNVHYWCDGLFTIEEAENCPVPDYPNDLTACHEMEQSMTDEQETEWRKQLSLIVVRDWESGKTARPSAIHATAAQRCEAFIKVVCPGKWKD
jgi:hypothetical protein